MKINSKIGKGLLFKESMSWEKEIEEFIKSRMWGFTLNVPCGQSELGNVRIDVLYPPKSKATTISDMRQIPWPDESFDTVIQDPPWKIDFYNRWKPFLECVRVCKVGGRIIYNATWIPASKQVELEELWIRQSASFANVSIISVFKRVSNGKTNLPESKVMNPSWAEPCYCSACDYSFVSGTPDPRCPKCNGIRDLYDSKEGYESRSK